MSTASSSNRVTPAIARLVPVRLHAARISRAGFTLHPSFHFQISLSDVVHHMHQWRSRGPDGGLAILWKREDWLDVHPSLAALCKVLIGIMV